MNVCLTQLKRWKWLRLFLCLAALMMACPKGAWAQEFSSADKGKPSAVNPDALKMLSDSAALAAAATNVPVLEADSGTTVTDAVNDVVDNAGVATDVSNAEAQVAVAMPTNSMDVLDNKYRLKIGDSVNFQVTEDEDDPKPLVVTDSGDLIVPYIGRYPAAGKTCKELAEELKVELEKKYYYKATVIVSVNSKTTQGIIYLVGGVKAPGPLEIPRDDTLTVSKAILRAGGFDDFADEKHVRITRKSQAGTNEVLTVNVSAVLDDGQTSKDMQAQPGDLIYVPEKTIRF
jgi:polysaccharide export outer membrane protein